MEGEMIDFRQLPGQKRPGIALPKYAFEHADLQTEHGLSATGPTAAAAEIDEAFFLDISQQIANGHMSEDEFEKLLLARIHEENGYV
jgi:hypothetical protein